MTACMCPSVEMRILGHLLRRLAQNDAYPGRLSDNVFDNSSQHADIAHYLSHRRVRYLIPLTARIRWSSRS